MTMTPPESTAEAPQLKPLSVGDMIDRVFRMYRQRPLLFITLSAIPNLVAVILAQGGRLVWPSAFIDFDQFQFVNDPNAFFETFARGGRTSGPGDLIVGLLSIIPQAVGICVLTYAAANMYLGRPVAFGPAFRAALADTPRLIFTIFVLFIVVVVALFAVILASAIPVAINPLFVVVLIITVAVWPFFLLTSFALVPTISALEDAGPLHSIRRSLQLIKGSRWRMLGVIVLLLVIEIVFSALLGAVFLGAFLAQSTAGRVAAVLVSAAAQIAWEPLPWAALALFYYDMRVRKEALDLQLAAEALPTTA